jgi:hypothetical protein
MEEAFYKDHKRAGKPKFEHLGTRMEQGATATHDLVHGLSHQMGQPGEVRHAFKVGTLAKHMDQGGGGKKGG